MDITKFEAAAPGSLTPIIAEWGADHAFIPAPLPPQWQFPTSLWPLLAEARQQVGVLEGLGRNLPNPAILLRPLLDREAIQSSRLEGTYASPKELLLYELNPSEAKSIHDKTNDHMEVYNYRRALHHGVASNLPISLRLIKELHQILLQGVRGRDKTPGEFRRIPVGIGVGGRFIPAPPDQLHELLTRLEGYCHTEQKPFDWLVDSFLIHYQFEAIHPFIDGNGRVGRLLLAIMLQQRGGLTKPWLYMSEFFEANRDEYIQCLFNISAKGDWDSWIEFCLKGTLKQAQETVRRCERLLQIREHFMEVLAKNGGSLRLKQIVDSIFHSPFVRTADIRRQLNCSYPTAKSDLEHLVSLGLLKELSGLRPRTYYAPQVYNVAYEHLLETDI